MRRFALALAGCTLLAAAAAAPAGAPGGTPAQRPAHDPTNLSQLLGGGRAHRIEVKTAREVTPREHLAALRTPAQNAQLHARGLAQAAAIHTTAGDRSWVERGPNPIGYDEGYEMGFTGWGDAGGRVTALAVDPEDPDVVWAGLTAAGLWRSADAGRTWTAFLQESPPAIEAIAIDPATGTVHVGTGGNYVDNTGLPGTGIVRTSDGGRTFQTATGVPEGARVTALAIAGPKRVFAASTVGLLVSTDGGASYRDALLPTDAAGAAPYDVGAYGSVVTDVVVHPDDPDRVTAVVGWFRGRGVNPGNTQTGSVGNGLYRSVEGGLPGTWERLDAPTFGRSSTSGDPIGVVTLAYATGPGQDHDVMWALIQDAGLYSGNGLLAPGTPTSINDLNGVYRSPDDGLTWELKGDATLLTAAQGSAFGDLVPTIYPAGIQSAFNQFLAVDPTDESRVLVGLEEVYEPTTDPALPGPAAWRTVARYWSDCQSIGQLLPACVDGTPTAPSGPTPHPDHHAVAITATADGVRFYDGNDGGLYVQDVATGAELAVGAWQPRNDGLRSSKPYYAVMDSVGNIIAGHQDNGTTRSAPGSLRGVNIHGGDGAGVAVDPTDPETIYAQYPFAGFAASADAGATWTYQPPPDTHPLTFIAPLVLDTGVDEHLVLGSGAIVYASTDGPSTMTGSWVPVFDVRTEDPTQRSFSVDAHDSAVYVTTCGNCAPPFSTGETIGRVATNVAQGCTPAPAAEDCWHQARAAGLPTSQFLTDVGIDRRDVRRVVVTVGDYRSRLTDAKPGTGRAFLSTDGAESFTDISAGLPDLPANSVVLRDDEIYVGTEAGVFFTPRAGTPFTRLGAGLPHTQVLDLTLNPQRSTLVAATHGRGVFTLALDSTSPLPRPRPPATRPGPRPAPLPATGANGWLAAVGAALLLTAAVARGRRDQGRESTAKRG